MSSRSTAASKRLPVGTSSSSSSSSTSSSINAGGIPLSTSGLPITSHAYSNSPLDDILASNGLTRYHLEPPTWRAPWTRSTTNTSNGAKVVPSSGGTSLQSLATVSYPQFYPTVDGQEEDQLTEQAVKAGFSNKAVVQTETFSAHQLIYEKLKSADILGNLARLAGAVQKRQQQLLPAYEPHSFRLPKRNTVSDQKRETWLADLANPQVPLSKLYAVVPNAHRGGALLEQMYTRKVPLNRAVWFIRAYGAGEIQAQLRVRPGAPTPSLSTVVNNYTHEWTTAVQEFVRKQLAEVTLESITSAASAQARPALSARAQEKKAVMIDNELRAAWTEKFSWTLRLLELLYEDHLLERESFLRFLVAQVDGSNIAQLPFVLFLVEEYLGEFLLTEPLSARLVAACFGRSTELSLMHPSSTASTSPHATAVHTLTLSTLTTIIRSTFLALPDAFVAVPALSGRSTPQIERLLLNLEEPALVATVKADLADLRARAEAARAGTEDGVSTEPDDLETIEILDSVVFPTSLSISTHKLLFHKRRRRRPLAVEVPILFAWATTRDRAGPHRRYAVASLLRLEKEELQALGRPKLDIAKLFIDWVDASVIDTSMCQGGQSDARNKPSHRPECSIQDACILLEELVRQDVLSFSLYMQRMIARGETEPRRDGTPSIHLQLLRSVALYEEAGTSLARRRVALRASPSGRAEIEQLIAHAKSELILLVPALAETMNDVGANTISSIVTAPADRDCSMLLVAIAQLAKQGSHLILQRHVIPHGLTQLARNNGAARALPLSPEDHAVIVQVYLVVEDYFGLLQYVHLVLTYAPSRELVGFVLDTLEADLDTWSALDALPALAESLLETHKRIKSSGSPDRRLVALLRQLARAGHLESSIAAAFEQECQDHASSLSTHRLLTQGLPPGLPELQSLIVDSSPQATAQLCTTLWYRYHSFENWGVIAFDSAIQLLAHVPTTTCLGFLREIADRLPAGLEPTLAKWIAALPSPNIVATFGGLLASKIATLLVDLVIDGVLTAPDLVSAVLIPTWKVLLRDLIPAIASSSGTNTSSKISPAAPGPNASSLRALETMASIFSQLVGEAEARAPDISNAPVALLRRQRASSRRVALYTNAALPDLGRCLSLLVLQQEVQLGASAGLVGEGGAQLAEKAHATAALVLHVESLSAFQLAVVRDPQVLAAAMLDCLLLLALPVNAAATYRPKLLAALLLAMKDSSTATPASLVSTEDWDLFLSGLTMWRLAISKVEVQACLERLDLDSLISEADKAEARHTLSTHFLDRVCSGDGHTYLGEQIVNCYHGPASDELVSVAFARIADAIKGLAADPSSQQRSDALTTLRCTGRLLSTLLDAASATSRTKPLNRLLSALKACLESAQANLSAASSGSNGSFSRDDVLHVTHLIVIALRCTPKGAGTETADLFKGCLVPCAKLAATLAKDRWREYELSSLLLDTCAHLLFGLMNMAPQSRFPALHTFLADDLELDVLPDSTLSRLTRLFGSTPALVPMVTNPWELLEHADAAVIAPPHQSHSGQQDHQWSIGSYATRSNAGPVDLTMFDARVVHVLPRFTALDAQSTSSSAGAGGGGGAGNVTGAGGVGNSSTQQPQSASQQPQQSQSGSMSQTNINTTGLITADRVVRGQQGNFDFETACTDLSVAARDHRRTLMSVRAFASRYDPLAQVKKKQQHQQQLAQAQAQAQAQAASSAPGTPASGSTTTTTAANKANSTIGEIVIDDDDAGPSTTSGRVSSTGKKASSLSALATGAGTKRKDPPEVVVISDDEDSLASKSARNAATTVAPAAKKSKKAGAGTGRKKTK